MTQGPGKEPWDWELHRNDLGVKADDTASPLPPTVVASVGISSHQVGESHLILHVI